VIEEVALLYPSVCVDRRFWENDGKLKQFSDEVLLSFVRETSRLDTSPGFPWIQLGCPTVLSVLERYPTQLCDVVRETLGARLRFSLEEARAMTPSELVRAGLRAVVRIFIKQEPHSLKKILSDRLRLIMNSGLSDIVCDRICLEQLASKEVDVWEKIPSKAGMGLDDDNIKRLRAGIPEGVESTDAKAWDWHVSEWLMRAAADVECKQYGVSVDSHLGHLIHMSVVLTCRKVWLTGTGHLFEQRTPGAQESGSRLTACRNSKMRVLLGHLAGALFVAAMGDDSVEKWRDRVFDPEGNYARMGFEMEVAILPEGVQYEFCSHHFLGDGTAVPLNWAKTLYRLLSHLPDKLLRMQFSYEMRHSPELPRLEKWIDEHWVVQAGEVGK